MILQMTTYVYHVPHLDLLGIGQHVIKRTTDMTKNVKADKQMDYGGRLIKVT